MKLRHYLNQVMPVMLEVNSTLFCAIVVAVL